MTKDTQSQYEAIVAVGSGVFVGGTGVLVGMAVGGNGVCVGALNVGAVSVCATTVCVTAAWMVAKVSGVGDGFGCINGNIIMVIGKQVTSSKTIEPAMIRVS